MSRQHLSAVVLMLVATASLLTGGAVDAQSPSNPAGLLSYTGRLTDPAGQPVPDGPYDFVFTLYPSEKSDQPLWSEMQTGLTLRTGDIKAELGRNVHISPELAERKDLWLSISVRGPHDADFTLLNPRHSLDAVPNAVAALTCPHSHFTDYWGGASSAYGLEVDNATGSGDGIRGYSGSTVNNYAGVYAYNGGGTAGGAGGSGVYAFSKNGYGGYFESQNYRGLYAKGNSAWYAAYIENPLGSTGVGLYVNGTLWVTGAKTGYLTDVALYDGSEPLETGEVVAINGVASPLAGEIPVIRVRKVTAENASAVVGVVDQGVTMQKGSNDTSAIPGVVGHDATIANNTAIKTGEYLLIVTMGSYKGVKVDATGASVHAGDALVAGGNSGRAGVAATASTAMPNTIVGKALGELKTGIGLVPVMVSIR
jgi:hypothetical protein